MNQKLKEKVLESLSSVLPITAIVLILSVTVIAVPIGTLLLFLAGAVLMLCGLGIFVIEMIGVFRFKYILNRMHAAAIGDTLGIGFSLLGLILMSGWNFTSLKLLFVIVFLWFASPVSSHLISRLEVTTDEEKEAHYKEIILGKQGEKNFVEETPEKAIEREDG